MILQITFQKHNDYIIKAGSLLPKVSDLAFLESSLFQQLVIDDQKIDSKTSYLTTENNKLSKQRRYVEGKRAQKVSSKSILSKINVFELGKF